jgi:formylglycine-generating enzyme
LSQNRSFRVRPFSPITGSVILLCSIAAAAAVADIKPFRDCADCPEMVAIPAGRFVMGAAPGEEERENLSPEFRNRSRPQREVEVKRFSAGRFEITRREYRAFAEETRRSGPGCFVWDRDEFRNDDAKDWRDPGYPQTDAHPVTCVSWEDAVAYVAWLSHKTSRRYRLLSEAEWEYAARAGTTTFRFWGDDVAESCSHANGADLAVRAQEPAANNWDVIRCNDRHAYTAPVGSYRPNAFGLFDMLGNVEEWTQDCWNADYTSASGSSRARADGDCGLRAVRGGSWLDGPVGVRSAYRVGSPITIRVFRRGFRVALDV